jgi:hypothetical protein
VTSADLPMRSHFGTNPESRRTVEQLISLETWSPWTIRAVFLLLDGVYLFDGFRSDGVSFLMIIVGLFGAMIGASIANWFLRRLIIGPMQSVFYGNVAYRLRSKTIVSSVKHWRAWALETPGVAALIADQLFLCDYSTGYDELLLSSWQIAAVHVELEAVAHTTNKECGRPRARDGRVSGARTIGRGRSTTHIIENAFLEIHYFARHDAPVRSTRIPFGRLRHEAEEWMMTIEQSKRSGYQTSHKTAEDVHRLAPALRAALPNPVAEPLNPRLQALIEKLD